MSLAPLVLLFASVLSSHAADTCETFEAGTTSIVKVQDSNLDSLFLSPDGKKAMINDYWGKPILVDLVSGEKTVLPREAGSLNYGRFSGDGASFLSSDGRNVVLIRLTQPPGIIPLKGLPSGQINIRNLVLNYDGTKAAFHVEEFGSGDAALKSSLIIVDMASPEETKVIRPPASYVRSLDLSPDGSNLVVSGNSSFLFDTRTGQIVGGDWEGEGEESRFSSDGIKVVSVGRSVWIRDLVTGGVERIAIPNEMQWPRNFWISPDGNKITLGPGIHEATAGKLWFLDRTTGETSLISYDDSLTINTNYHVRVAGQTVVRPVREGGRMDVFVRKPICARPLKIDKDCAHCKAEPEPAIPLEGLLNDALCPLPFDAKTWDARTPAPQGASITLKEAQAFLLRFQKPGGFDPEKHLGILVAILRSNLPKQFPGQVHSALQGALNASPVLYRNLVAKFPMEVADLVVQTASEKGPVCRTAEEESAIQKSNRDYVEGLTIKFDGGSKLSEWESIGPLKPALIKLAPEQKEELIDKISESLRNGALKDEQFSDVFSSKLYYLSRQAVAPWFGEKPQAMTDLTVARVPPRDGKPMRLKPIVLGTAPINGKASTATPYGFYSKLLMSVELGPDPEPGLDVLNTEVSWKHDKEQFTANLKMKVEPSASNMIPDGAGPDYPAMWQDGKLTGVIFGGANLSSSVYDMMDSYLSYYEDDGFEFDDLAPVPDLKKFLAERVRSGEADYLSKEAHSGGDEKNLVQIDGSARVYKGTKVLEGGRKEVVYLVMPPEEASSNVYIKNEEFGEWIREREAAKKGQLAYINGSCGSTRKAYHEIEAARSRILLNIPSSTSSTVFTYHKNDAMRLLLDAFRSGKSFEEIRANMRNNEQYRSRSKNNYLFPDEPGYDKHVKRYMMVPISGTPEIRGPDGQPYNMTARTH